MSAHPPPDEPDDDPLAAYADGVPDAVRAARPVEPDGARWEAVRKRIHTRVRAARRGAEPDRAPRGGRRRAAAAALSGAVAAAAIWIVLGGNPHPPRPRAVEPVGPTAAPAEVAVAPGPHEPHPDPLAEFAVLPIAEESEVVLLRVPGDGWLPVGTHPLPGPLPLATAGEVELDEPNPAWPNATPAPGAAPMIFAAKPR
jgi:hypothetical protein